MENSCQTSDNCYTIRIPKKCVLYTSYIGGLSGLGYGIYKLYQYYKK